MWEAKDQKLHVNYNASVTNLSAISKAIAKVGHDTEKDKAIPEVYKALPGCCKYKK
jgi:Cu(I)/Ag(I) efflux system membrane fusion protein